MSKFLTKNKNLLLLLSWFNLAIASPLIQKIGNFPDFLVAHQANSFEILALVSFILLAPALFIYFIYLLFYYLISKNIAKTFFSLCLLILFSITALLLLNSFEFSNAWLEIFIAFVIGLFFLYLYIYKTTFTKFSITLLVLVPLTIFTLSQKTGLINNLFHNKNSSASFSKTKTPVAVLIFDELPLNAIMNSKGAIDSINFPNFKRLASISNWYKNATTLSTRTEYAVPVILSGSVPSHEAIATSRDYPENLFSILSSTHNLHVYETVTNLCSTSSCSVKSQKRSFYARIKSLLFDSSAIYLNVLLPKSFHDRIPSLDGSWKDFWLNTQDEEVVKIRENSKRLVRYRKFLSEIVPTKEPVLHFYHILFPHTPHEFLPSLKTYSHTGQLPWAYQKEVWIDNEWGRLQAYQRFYLQVLAADKILGEFLDALESASLLDSSLVLVASDHGITFEVGSHRRGVPGFKNFIQDDLRTLLFIKTPNQKNGTVSEKLAQTNDVLPSIAEILNIKLTSKKIGKSLFKKGENNESKNFVLPRKYWKKFQIPFEAYEYNFPKNESLDTVHWRESHFGVGRDLNMFNISIRPHLLNKKVTGFLSQSKNNSKLKLIKSNLIFKDKNISIVNFDPETSFSPIHVFGRLNNASDKQVEIALVVNGKIVGATKSYKAKKKGKEFRNFSILFSESNLNSGLNEYSLYEILEKIDKTLLLLPITDIDK